METPERELLKEFIDGAIDSEETLSGPSWVCRYCNGPTYSVELYEGYSTSPPENYEHDNNCVVTRTKSLLVRITEE